MRAYAFVRLANTPTSLLPSNWQRDAMAAAVGSQATPAACLLLELFDKPVAPAEQEGPVGSSGSESWARLGNRPGRRRRAAMLGRLVALEHMPWHGSCMA